jgi:6-phosphogluconolactonase
VTLSLEVAPDPEAAGRRVAGLVAERARAAVEDRGAFDLAVSGGSTPEPMLRALGQEDVPWERVRIYQVDERVAPPGSSERNLTQLLATLPFEAHTSVRPMPVDEPDLQQAAERYAAELPPRLDLVHLGLGADGHTASLVPGDRVLDVTDRLVAVTGEYEGRRRMTLTYPALDAARELVWLVTGAEKRDALSRLLARDASIPAARISSPEQLVVADVEAVTPELRDDGLAPDLRFDGLIVDLDGVVWVGATAVPGSIAAIAQLRARGVRLLFMTNDPRGSRSEHAARLRALGVPADESEIVTSASALASLVREREGVGTTAFVIGSPSFKAELAQAGLELLAGEAGRDADVVAVGGHEGFDYGELRVATQALRRGARLYAAGRDATFPMPDGPWPGTGSVVAAVEVAGGRTAITVGKPEPFIFDIARSLLVDCRRVAIVGDNLAADIAGGKRAGLTTILVLTGTSGRDDVAGAEVTPDIVLPDLAALIEMRP